MSSPAAEHALQSQVIKTLKTFDELTLQTNVPLRSAGVMVDVIAKTDKKQIVIEASASEAEPAIEAAVRKAEHIQRVTGAANLLVVLPEAPTPGAQPDFVIGIDGLEKSVQEILDQPVFRAGPADLGADEDAQVVFAAMPYKLGFDNTYFLGVVDAAMKTGVVIDRIDSDKEDERVKEGIQNAVGVVVDLSGGDEHVTDQLAVANEVDKETIKICNEDEVPEGVDDAIMYTPRTIDKLRNTLVEKFNALIGG